MPTKDLFIRLYTKLVRVGDCLEWSSTTDRDGYGQLAVVENGRRSNRRTHRLVWELTRGPIPAGLRVLHKCDNRRCCEPGHLFLGTDAHNLADMRSKGRAFYQTRTHCKHGHALSTDRAGLPKGRACYVCYRNSQNKYFRKYRAKHAAKIHQGHI